MQLIMQFVKHMFTPEFIEACHTKGIEYLLTQNISALSVLFINNKNVLQTKFNFYIMGHCVLISGTTSQVIQYKMQAVKSNQIKRFWSHTHG